MTPNEAHAFGRQALAAAWPVVTGHQASLAELQIAGAQAHLESGYGRAPYRNALTGETAVLNNWGAIQAGPPPCGPNAFETTDTHADGTPYQFCYRRWPDAVSGAAELVRQLTLRRPTSWENMKRGDIDAWSKSMRERDPVTGVGLYFEQSAEGRAKGIELRVGMIAQALGEPIAAKRGGPANDGGDGGPRPPSGNDWTGPIVAAVVAAAFTLTKLILGR